MRACGHEPVFAVRNLAGVAPVLGGDDFPVFQAPCWHWKRRPGPGPTVTAGFGDIMALQGYAEVEGLLGMVRGWQALIDLVRPRLIVCDFSPTACLAAFGVIPVVIVGNGFTVPPAGLDAFPPLIPEAPPIIAQQALLDVIREVQSRRGRPAPSTLPGLFAGERFILVFPELDPYQGIRREPCHGPIGSPPTPSPLPEAPSIFAYLDGDRPLVEECLAAVSGGGIGVSAYVRGASAGLARRLRALGVVLHDAPQRPAETLPHHRAVLHHGSLGMAQDALAAGRPQVVWPNKLEHALTSRALAAMGVAVWVGEGTQPAVIAEAVRTASSEPRMAEQAMAWGERLRSRTRPDPLGEIVERCHELAR
jgi:rhamnosyltransferase subunit B